MVAADRLARRGHEDGFLNLAAGPPSAIFGIEERAADDGASDFQPLQHVLRILPDRRQPQPQPRFIQPREHTLNGLRARCSVRSSTAMSRDSGDIPTTVATGPALPSAPNCVSAPATALTFTLDFKSCMS